MITVCVFKVWISYPFMMMMMGAALQTIDRSVSEAAAVDGCTGWRRLRYMTLPMTARTTYIAWILMVMFSVNDFPTIFLLTGGGPVNSTTTLILMAFRAVFNDFLPGYGVAISFIITIVLVALSIFLLRQIRRASLA
jgi:multiple sugar transport system permease protein